MEELKSKLEHLVDEALALRISAHLPEMGADVHTVVDSLLDTRHKADRLEGLHIQALQVKAKISRIAASAKAEADDAWASAISDMRSAAVRNRDTYEGPRERYAEADLASIAQKRKARKAEELLSLAEEADSIIRIAFKGLNEVIQDHRTWLRSLQFQSYLEK